MHELRLLLLLLTPFILLTGCGESSEVAPPPAVSIDSPAVVAGELAASDAATSLPLRLPPTGDYQTTSPIQLLLPDQVPVQLQQMWDGAEHNVIYMVHTGWENKPIFDLHLLEELIVSAEGWPQRHFKNSRRLNADLWQWQEHPDGWHFTLDQQEVLDVRIEGRVWAEEDQVHVAGRITNRMKHAWSGGEGLMCLRTRSAPEFVETSYRNVYLFPAEPNGAERISVLEHRGIDYNPQVEGSQYFNAWVSKPGSPPFKPRIVKYDRTGRRSLEFETAPGIGLGGNRQPGMNCIHANVEINIAPGETMPYSSTIQFQEADQPVPG